MTDIFNETATRKLLADARKLLVKNITDNPRPGEEELLLMSEPYKMVWETYEGPPPAFACRYSNPSLDREQVLREEREEEYAKQQREEELQKEHEEEHPKLVRAKAITPKPDDTDADLLDCLDPPKGV